ncbi:ORF111 [Ranid herpesvirus 1]|uniref:ORF111 n=1 Tax=Ranid herpesvirus 1 TaxID=85655 RepID=Q14VL9_9VIRU|nr:ORF111 [Ranid herpesvirus 1]ABG25722.1 ORF111 [Ranid herpesvirus 1]
MAESVQPHDPGRPVTTSVWRNRPQIHESTQPLPSYPPVPPVPGARSSALTNKEMIAEGKAKASAAIRLLEASDADLRKRAAEATSRAALNAALVAAGLPAGAGVTPQYSLQAPDSEPYTRTRTTQAHPRAHTNVLVPDRFGIPDSTVVKHDPSATMKMALVRGRETRAHLPQPAEPLPSPPRAFPPPHSASAHPRPRSQPPHQPPATYEKLPQPSPPYPPPPIPTPQTLPQHGTPETHRRKQSVPQRITPREDPKRIKSEQEDNQTGVQRGKIAHLLTSPYLVLCDPLVPFPQPQRRPVIGFPAVSNYMCANTPTAEDLYPANRDALYLDMRDTEWWPGLSPYLYASTDPSITPSYYEIMRKVNLVELSQNDILVDIGECLQCIVGEQNESDTLLQDLCGAALLFMILELDLSIRFHTGKCFASRMRHGTAHTRIYTAAALEALLRDAVCGTVPVDVSEDVDMSVLRNLNISSTALYLYALKVLAMFRCLYVSALLEKHHILTSGQGFATVLRALFRDAVAQCLGDVNGVRRVSQEEAAAAVRSSQHELNAPLTTPYATTRVLPCAVLTSSEVAIMLERMLTVGTVVLVPIEWLYNHSKEPVPTSCPLSPSASLHYICTQTRLCNSTGPYPPVQCECGEMCIFHLPQ